MKFLIDMNLSPSWVEFLSEAGIRSVHWSEIGSSSAPDSELFAWAVQQDYVLLTADLDFGAILAVTALRKPSVVQLRTELLDPHIIGGIVLAAIRRASDELREGALLSVHVAKSRLRILPFRPN